MLQDRIEDRSAVKEVRGFSFYSIPGFFTLTGLETAGTRNCAFRGIPAHLLKLGRYFYFINLKMKFIQPEQYSKNFHELAVR